MLPHASADTPSTNNTSSTSPLDDTITITVDSSCTIGQEILSLHTTDLNPGETNTTIGTSRISAYCNDSNGYDIYAIGYTNGEYGNTNMQSTTTTSTSTSTTTSTSTSTPTSPTSTTPNTIPTGTSGEGSYWNMKLTPGTSTSSPSYIPTIVSPFTTNTTIPNDYTKVVTYPSSTTPQGSDPLSSGSYFTTTYQAHASVTQPAGTYNGQVQYVMVHPHGAPAPTFMQNTTAIKAKLTNIGDTMQAIDKRDGKKYWITKLADGNIWMTQNLDHDIVAGKTYTSADTDLPEGTTWIPSTSTYHVGDTTWDSSNYTPESYDPGDRYWDGRIGIGSGTIEDNTTTYGDEHWHIGNYYNWTATVAMNDSSSYSTRYEDVNQSICPAGWRLSTYNDGKSFSNLFGYLTAGVDGDIQKPPAYFVYGGSWAGGSVFVGRFGAYWYGVVASDARAMSAGFHSHGGKNAQTVDARPNGFSVRCVAR